MLLKRRNVRERRAPFKTLVASNSKVATAKWIGEKSCVLFSVQQPRDSELEIDYNYQYLFELSIDEMTTILTKIAEHEFAASSLAVTDARIALLKPSLRLLFSLGGGLPIGGSK